MPKDRRYTRKELETLRRADLQSLFKMHGMKGANQSTKSMIDALVNLFESATYLSPTRRNVNMVEKLRRAPLGGPTKAVRELKKRPSATRIPPAEPVMPVEEVRTEEIVMESQVAPSQLPTVMPPPAIPPTISRSSSFSRTSVQEMLDARDRIWEARLKAVEEAFERRVLELEKRVEETIRSLSSSMPGIPGIPEFTLTNSTPTRTMLGKRVEREDSSQTPGAGPSHMQSSPASKRQRMQSTEEDDSDALSPHTPSPPRAIPRTPSPGHQGSLLDNSQTPGVGMDFLPSHYSTMKRQDKEVNETRDFSYPLFATTPRPSEPRSPTLDAPPSARSRMGYHRGATLTPGRRVASPAPRSVSDAHKELTTITESDEVSIPVSVARRRVASEQTPTRLISASLRGGSVPVSPPQLSPSPSIGDRDGGFSFTPFPPVPRGMVHSGLKQSTLAGKTRTPEQAGRGPASLDYMEMAMQGMEPEIGIGGSTAMATPHRTMLGTERYRDTRFGDVPMVQWGSPSIDLGPNTPASYRRDW